MEHETACGESDFLMLAARESAAGVLFDDILLAAAPSVGRKDDAGKADWTLVPWTGMEPVVRVLMAGARKYGRDNWRLVPELRRRYQAAAMRHLVAHCSGGSDDAEDGLPHLAHVVCCALFILAADAERARGGGG